ncbi:uncharacterized protein [Salvelinus alpinus]|uniref:uncharacterized protein isoform X3 n=1 Tax=Salvelinus alpinus TaxID=8036 RepID=UPI0039FD4733
MSSSVMSGVAVWRAHSVLEESDGGESSSPVAPPPDRFRKLRSSSSLNSLRMSLRKRLPLSSVQRLQRNRAVVQDQEECLVATPGQVCEGGENNEGVTSRTPRRTPVRSTTLIPTTTPRRTPRATAPKRTPASGRGGRRTPGRSPEVTGVKNVGGRRQLVRMAALRSPFASPNTQSLRRKFGRDLESVSSGLRKLKRLSHAFDDVIGRDDRRTFNYSLIAE